MKKTFGRMAFMLTFYWLGTAYALAGLDGNSQPETGRSAIVQTSV